jgi:Zn-dependent metalloprotease
MGKVLVVLISILLAISIVGCDGTIFGKAAFFSDGSNVEEIDFQDGTFSSTQYDLTTDSIFLTSGSSTGTYTSAVYDAGSSTTWDTISWLSNTLGESSEGKEDETGSKSGNLDMTGNALLYHFDNDVNSGESNTLVHDFSGNNNTATPQNGAVPDSNSKRFGVGSYSLDGANDYIKVPDSDSFDSSTALSASAWIAPGFAKNVGSNKFLFDKRQSQNSGWRVFYASSTDVWRFLFQTGSGITKCDATVPDEIRTWNVDEWHNIVVTYDGSVGNIYWDGELVESCSNPGELVTNTQDLFIGSNFNGASTFQGNIDEIVLFNRALSVQEVHDSYIKGNVLLYHFDNDASSGESNILVHDFSNGGNDGSVSGAVPDSVSKKSGAGSYSFDGVDDYITVSDGPWLDINSKSFTATTWLAPDFAYDVPGGALFLFDKQLVYSSGWGTGWRVFYAPSTDVWRFRFHTTTGTQNCDAKAGNEIPIWNPGEWHHMAVRFDGSQGRIYWDGELVKSCGRSGHLTTNEMDLTIGSNVNTIAGFFDGNMDEFGIWDVALSDAEINNLYTGEATNLDFSVRSCDDNTCSGESFVDIEDVSPQQLSLVDNQYFQYQVGFSTDDVSVSPVLDDVSVDHQPDSSAPTTITPTTVNPATGLPENTVISGVHVSDIDPTISDVTEANVDTVAKAFLNQNQDLFQVDTTTLVNPVTRTQKNGDLVNVIYGQEYQGIPVARSFVNVIASYDNLVYVNQRYFPEIDVDTTPVITSVEAIDLAKLDLGTTVAGGSALLVVYPVELPTMVEYKLAWKVVMPIIEIENEIKQMVYYISADFGEIIHQYNSVNFFSTTDNSIEGKVTAEVFPEHPGQEKISVDLENQFVRTIPDASVGLITTTTNSQGDYDFTNLPSAPSLQFSFKGPFVEVFNDDEVEATRNYVVKTMPTVVNNNWVNYDNSHRQEESNVFYHVNVIHDYLTKDDYGTGAFSIHELDFPIEVMVEVGDFSCNAASSCNHLTGDTRLKFFGPGTCPSSALYADIIYHEYTHSAVCKILAATSAWDYWNEGEGAAMNEGLGDHFANSLTGNSCHNENYIPGKDCSRNSLNIKKYPGDMVNQEHQDSVIFSGALWDLSQMIGFETTNSLVLYSLKLLPLSFSEFLNYMLLVDDDNHDLADGTPHITEICDSFTVNHGIQSESCLGFTSAPVILLDVPKNMDVYPLGTIINLEGTIYSLTTSGSDTLSVQYANLEDVSAVVLNKRNDLEWLNTNINWRSEGVTIINDDSGILGTIDSLQEGYYIFKVVSAAGEAENFETLIVGVMSNIKDGFPIKNTGVGNIFSYFSLSASDLDLDGVTEIVSNSAGRSLIFNSDGEILRDGFSPRALKRDVAFGNLLHSIEDEVIISESLGSSHSGISIYVSQYDLKTSVTPIFDNEKISSPLLIDIDNDDLLEFAVIMGVQPELYLFDNPVGSSYSEVMEGYPVKLYDDGDPWNRDIFVPAPATADLDNDGYFDIIAWGSPKKLYAFNRQGEILPGWPVETGIIFYDYAVSSPIIGDLDNDGDLEVIVVVDDGDLFSHRNSFLIYALHHDGSLMDGWPITLPGDADLYHSPSIGDLDNDGDLEIVYAKSNKIYVWHHDGSLVAGWPIISQSNSGMSFSIANIDGDVEPEILLTKGKQWDKLVGDFFAWNNDGSVVAGWPKKIFGTSRAIPLVGDLDNDGLIEIALNTLNHEILMWDTNAVYSPDSIEWGSSRHDSQNTGNYNFDVELGREVFHNNPICGNGIPESSEECDDGKRCAGDLSQYTVEQLSCLSHQDCVDNPLTTSTTCSVRPNDGCSNTCVIEYCGDGIRQQSEQCDDGSTSNLGCLPGCNTLDCSVFNDFTPTSFWPGGGHYEDITGYSDAINFGVTPLTNAQRGQGFEFDSSGSDYMSVDSVSLPSDKITVSFWMKTTDTDKTLLSYSVPGEDFEFVILDTRFGSMVVYISGTGANTNIEINDGLWHYLTFTWRSSDGQIEVYVDGVREFVAQFEIGNTIKPGGTLVFGQTQLGSSFHPNYGFTGILDEIAIWDRVLSVEQIGSSQICGWVEICTDELDNDGDDRIDCLDSDCQDPDVLDQCTINGITYIETGTNTGEFLEI